MGDYESWVCLRCGNKTIIPVAESDGVKLYSCTEEDCQWYAQVLIMMDDGIFVSRDKLLKTYFKLWDEHEQDKIQESED